MNPLAGQAGSGNGGSDNGNNKDGGWGDLTKIIAAGTAFVGLLSALAVAGIIGRFERNHGTLFILACALVLAGASLWVVAAVPKAQGRVEKGLQYLGLIVLFV